MRRVPVAVALMLAGALGGCDLSGGSGDSDGLDALRAARAKARAAPYFTVLTGSNRQEFAPGLTVLSHKRRIFLWETRHVSYAIDKAHHCYSRTTAFNRADLRELRRDAVVADALMHAAESTDHHSIRWRGPDAEEGYRVEGEVYLDGAGRPVRSRERTIWLSGKPRDPWSEERYLYPSSGDRVPHPGPVCARH